MQQPVRHTHPPTRRSRAWVWFGALVALTVLLAGSVVAAEDASDLRGDVPTGAVVRARLADLAEQRTALVGDLARLEGRLDAAFGERAGLSTAEQLLAGQIEAVRKATREFAVHVFVTAGPEAGLRVLLNLEQASDLQWRQHLLDNTLNQPVDANLALLQELEAQASEALLVMMNRIEEINREVRDVKAQISRIQDHEVRQNALLVVADAWDRAEIAIAEGDHGFAPMEKWLKLRECESTHNYQALSPSETYRGAYQFDYNTWKTVGGVGDPAAASPSEQDARARELYARRGAQPWPVCGRFLK